jgi:sulfur carrier protein
MTIVLNGETREVVDGMTVGSLLDSLSVRPDGTAVALNDQVLPRARQSSTGLHEGDRLEVIVAVAGG